MKLLICLLVLLSVMTHVTLATADAAQPASIGRHLAQPQQQDSKARPPPQKAAPGAATSDGDDDDRHALPAAADAIIDSTVNTNKQQLTAPAAEHANCIPVGACIACDSDEMESTFCVANGYKQKLQCTEIKSPKGAANPAAKDDAATTVEWAPCDNIDPSANEWTYWLFNMAVVVVFIGSAAGMIQRKSVLNSIQNRRLDRMVNS